MNSIKFNSINGDNYLKEGLMFCGYSINAKPARVIILEKLFVIL